MSIGERLKQAREALGLKQTEIAKTVGFESNFLSNIERGVKKPTKAVIELFSSRYKINANWLFTGEGNMFLEDTAIKTAPLVNEIEKLICGATSQKFSEIETRLSALESVLKQDKPASTEIAENDAPIHLAEADPEYLVEEKHKRIPYVYDIAAGHPIAQSEDHSETILVPVRLMRRGGQYYAATIRGDSMVEAGIRDGDMVLIRYTNVPKDGAIQVVRYQEKSTLKLLREVEGKGWELHYRDGTGRVITCDSNEYEVQGEFEAVIVVLPGKANAKEL